MSGGCCGRAARRASGIAYNCNDRAADALWCRPRRSGLIGARRLTGLFWQCATRDTRRLVLPGQMHKTGIGILSGEPMPDLRLVPAACVPHSSEWCGSGPGRALCGPAGRDRIAHRHRERGMADSRSDVDIVRAVLEHLSQEIDQGRPARDVLRAIWLEAIRDFPEGRLCAKRAGSSSPGRSISCFSRCATSWPDLALAAGATHHQAGPWCSKGASQARRDHQGRRGQSSANRAVRTRRCASISSRLR